MSDESRPPQTLGSRKELLIAAAAIFVIALLLMAAPEDHESNLRMNPAEVVAQQVDNTAKTGRPP